MTGSAGGGPEGGIATRLQAVRAEIDTACRFAGREPSQVRLLPVSKTRPVSDLAAAMDAGYRSFAENQVAELAAKAQALSERGAHFEMVGHLQSNKAAVVARWAARFHSLDSIKLAEVLDRRLQSQGRELEALIQVNSSGEASKFGLPPGEVTRFAQALAPYHSLKVTGLMTIAAHTEDPVRIAECFATTQRLAARLRDEAILDSSWSELSMGMSADFALAIAHGATIVRVGRAIFGARS